MATKANAKPTPRQSSDNRSSPPSYFIPPPTAVVNKTDEHGQIVFVISLIAVMLVLPLFLYLMVSIYFDMLVLQQEHKQQQAIIRRLIVELENKK